ncbi:MTOR-associated protein MEAK7 isoform X2 [Varanus komodoensis]|uniref:MTOR-associated protein MEAK7 isoform X2 n=1 Tax=Varanus komodoensis TaxID=61221 RepID=UPI001CF7B0DE|nr:MTOR-associated protein MEAK7 isoform X2 [Varanus komodoensis]
MQSVTCFCMPVSSFPLLCLIGLHHLLEKMGNVQSSSSYQKHLSRLLPEERADIDAIFSTLSGSEEASVAKSAKKGVSLLKLKAYVKDALPESMVVRLYDGMKSIQLTEKLPDPGAQVAKEQFVVFLSAIFKGNAEEKSGIILRMISNAGGPVKESQILEFAEDLVGSLAHVLNYRNDLKGWYPKNMHDSTAGVKALAVQLVSELKSAHGKSPGDASAPDATCDESSIEDWLFRVPQVSVYLSAVVQRGLLALRSPADQPEDLPPLLPKCSGLKGHSFVSLLNLPAVAYINSHLPSELQQKWRLLFASSVHGESFTQLCGHIVNKGPCVLVLKDTDGHIFGGFSSSSWEVKPQFQGNSSCFLFSVAPTLAVFSYTGYNDHYMYLNHGQQTMPNGLGMGGQHGYFGLWVDSNYGKGHSRAKPRCTTYNSPQLSAKENFTLDAMEEKGPKSILDADPEAQALLELIGKGRQSDGLRAPADEDGDN